jgi:putative restriction endonuclease
VIEGAQLCQAGFVGVVEYTLMGTDPNSADNRWLLGCEASDPGHLFSRHFARSVSNPSSRRLSLGGIQNGSGFNLLSGQSWGRRLKLACQRLQSAAMRFARSRPQLHQASFRDAVLTAYRGRCAISHLPHTLNGIDGNTCA